MRWACPVLYYSHGMDSFMFLKSKAMHAKEIFITIPARGTTHTNHILHGCNQSFNPRTRNGVRQAGAQTQEDRHIQTLNARTSLKTISIIHNLPGNYYRRLIK
jgi:hypothetical protein